jgi:mannose-6-phosphate isomerase-like protein (cupin superfamily)
MPGRLPVYKLSDIPRENRLHEGRMTRYSIRTKNAQIVFAEITPQPVGSQRYHRQPHDHPHDMLVIVTKGTMRMEIAGEEYDIGEGSVVDVPAFAMHRGYALGEKPVSLIEIFSPVRHDYIHLVEWQKEAFGDNGVPWVKEEFNSWNPPPGP